MSQTNVPNTNNPADDSVFRRTLTRAVVIPVILLVVLVGIFLIQLSAMLNTNRQVQHNNMVINQATVVLKLLVDMESGLRGYLLTDDKSFLEPYSEAQANFDTAFDLLENMVTDDAEQTQNLADLKVSIADWRTFADGTLKAEANGQQATAESEGRQRIAKQEMDSIRDQLADFVNTQSQTRNDAIRAVQTTTQVVIISVIVGGLLVGALVAFSTMRQLVGLSRSYEQALELSRRHADEEAAQREWLRGTLSSIGDAVIASDTQGKVTFINPVTAAITGLSLEDAVGKPLSDVYKVHQQSTEPSEGLNGKVLHVGDGKAIPIEDNIASIKDSHGNPIGTVVVFRDITRRKAIEQERLGLLETQEHYANQLRQSNEQLQQFAYIASHDLQEPLRMVISYLQLLERRYASGLPEDAREFIGFAVDGASRMRELITSLLQYARLDTPEQDAPHLTAMQSALDKALTNLSIPIEESKAVITHDTLPEVYADPMQMMQLLQNLIGNSIKFRSEQPLKIHIGVARKAQDWEFSVRDNGIGIAPEYQRRIFGLFQRLHVTTAYSGTGIGLTICKKIIERHNGRIWVESTVGTGSTFYFTLPVRPASG